MPKWAKTIIAILLLPVCVGAVMGLWRAALASGTADTVWVPLGAGAACWLVIYLLLPKPMWIYVLGHEFTHALWTWAMGGKVLLRKTRISSAGGHVVVSKSNFLIALAPYFFPLYAVIVVLVFAAGDVAWDWQKYRPFFHLLLGAAYAFHVTLTWHILKTHQTDISEQGYIFSAVIIFLGNVAVLLAGIALVGGKVSLSSAAQWWLNGTIEAVRRVGQAFGVPG